MAEIKELKIIADDLKAARPVASVTVREFLRWFGAQRRSILNVAFIRARLKLLGVNTVPDFESTWLDTNIRFELNTLSAIAISPPDPSLEGVCLEEDSDEPVTSWIRRDPSYRLSKLAAANRDVTPVGPDAPLSEAVTLMLAKGFSQLPVMVGERGVKGVISWKSIGSRLTLGYQGSNVRNMMEPAHEIKSDASIFDAIKAIVEHEYVLVRDEENKITGIITASDLSLQFLMLTEPFLLLSEIENLIRNLIGDQYTASELSSARDPTATGRDITSVTDLSFGEYIRLIEKPDKWDKLNLPVDRTLFCDYLHKVRVIRNDVMHFDPDGITPEDVTFLQSFTSFLKNLEAIQESKRAAG